MPNASSAPSIASAAAMPANPATSSAPGPARGPVAAASSAASENTKMTRKRRGTLPKASTGVSTSATPSRSAISTVVRSQPISREMRKARRSEVQRNVSDYAGRELDHDAQHPRPEGDQRQDGGGDLRHERERR